jgi:hypothetical protein
VLAHRTKSKTLHIYTCPHDMRDLLRMNMICV